MAGRGGGCVRRGPRAGAVPNVPQPGGQHVPVRAAGAVPGGAGGAHGCRGPRRSAAVLHPARAARAGPVGGGSRVVRLARDGLLPRGARRRCH
eukprot:1188509-Prorocentrum_minimum.AAC.1